MKAIEEKRKHFEKLWIGGGGHFKYYKYDSDIEKYTYTGIKDHLTNIDLTMGLNTLNLAWIFYIGGWEQCSKNEHL